MELNNFRLIPELGNLVAASAIPFFPEQIREIKKRKISTVITLLTDDELENVDIGARGFRNEMKKNGLAWFQIPVADHGVPTKKEFELFCGILNRLEQKNQRVLVHCTNGNGRVGAMLAGYLIREKGFFLEDAIRRMQSGNQHQKSAALPFPESLKQEEFLKSLEKKTIGKNRLSPRFRPALHAFRKMPLVSFPDVYKKVPSLAVLNAWKRLRAFANSQIRVAPKKTRRINRMAPRNR
ncbi:MAG: dual specificity protein phosphatase family protein [Candidatus Micrarchaeota archaeon]